MTELKLTGMGRSTLLALVTDLRGLIAGLQARNGREYQAMFYNLGATQKRCTELLEENRTLRASLILPGWFCRGCGTFNGEAKEVLTMCRSCDSPRPTYPV
jgi:hypothetical protein